MTQRPNSPSDYGDAISSPAAYGDAISSPAAYGDTFAQVYDDWYADVTDVGATVDTLVRLSGGGNLLELGVGTGRIAVPLAARLTGSARIVGIDASASMLQLMARKVAALPADTGNRIVTHLGDMKDPAPGGPFSVVFCTFNTFFNLPSPDAQRECLHNASRSLAPGGAVVLETAVFDENPPREERRETRVRPDGSTVRSVSRITSTDTAEGEFADDHGNVWPWRICFASPARIDEMARTAGDLVCTDRWEDFARRPFVPTSPRQVCVLRRRL